MKKARTFKYALLLGFVFMLALWGCKNSTSPSTPAGAVVIPTVALKLGDEGYAVSCAADTTVSNASRSILKDIATLKVVIDAPDATVTANGTAFTSGSDLDCSSKVTFVVTPTAGGASKTYAITITPYDSTTNPYGIYTAAQLSDVRNEVSASYIVKNDIELPALTGYDNTADTAGMKIADYSTKGWMPVATFTGSLDGGNFHIRNLVIKRSTVDRIGFIATALNVTVDPIVPVSIKNLVIDTGADGIAGRNNVGVLAGWAESGTFTSITTSGKVAAASIGAGGVFGMLTSAATLSASSSSAAVSGKTSVGGLVGKAGSTNTLVTITGSYSTGAITKIASGDWEFGGLVGSLVTGTISLCWSSASVSGAGSSGGLVGGNYAFIDKSYATGNVTGSGNYAGGLVGANSKSVSNSYSTGSVRAVQNVGGLVGANNSTSGSVPSLSSSWSTSTVTSTTSSTIIGPVFGSSATASWTSNCYYAIPSLGTITGLTAIDSSATQDSFAGFSFATPAVWQWNAGNWPTLADTVGTAQTLVALPAAVVIADNNPSITIKLGDEGFVVTGTGKMLLNNAPKSISQDLATLKVVIEVPNTTITANGTAFTSGTDVDCRRTVTFVVTPTNGSPALTYTLTISPYSADNPYGIYTAAHLSAVRDAGSANYVIKNDIALPALAGYDDTADLSGMKFTDYSTMGWKPIATFAGTLDGGNFHISNLVIKRPAVERVGLVSYAPSATIRNLVVDTGADGVTGLNFVGALAGWAEGGTYSFITTSGKVAAASSGAGGAIGVLTIASRMSDSSSSAAVSGKSSVGGLIGKGGTANTLVTITNSYSTGPVTSITGADWEFGGLVGSLVSGSISLCWSSGSVSGVGATGGLVGGNYGSIDKSYATGNVTGSGEIAGGVAGVSTGNLTNSYSTGTVVATQNVGGLAGRINSSSGLIATPSVSSSWSTSAVTATTTGGSKGPIFGSSATASWTTNCYYSIPSLGSVDGITALDASATQASFAGFSFATPAVWIWNAGKWPTLANTVGAAQTLVAMPPVSTLNNPEITVRLGDEGLAVTGVGPITVNNAPRSIISDLATLKVVLVVPNNTITANGAAFTSGADIDCRGVVTFAITPSGSSVAKIYVMTIPPAGSNSNPYSIYSAAQLSAMRDEGSASYVLKNDIALPALTGYNNTTDTAGMKIADYSTMGWMPIATFTGTLDGGNFHISNLVIKRPAVESVGLIGSAVNATIKNLAIETGVDGIAGLSAVGVMAGWAAGGTYTNITTSGKVAAANASAGGICGVLNSAATLSTSSSSVAVSGKQGIGGLVGKAGVSNSLATITNSYSTGAVTAITGADWEFGGLVGSLVSGSISLCWSSGSVSGVGTTGGLVGGNYGSINKSYATGNATGSGDYAGGLVGSSTGNITNSYSTGSVTARQHVGGLVGLISSVSGSVPLLTSSWSASAVTSSSSSTSKGPIFGSSATASWTTNCYYPIPSVGTVAGTTALDSTATKASFAGFVFDAPAVWVWNAGKWPTLANTVGAAQTLVALPAATP